MSMPSRSQCSCSTVNVGIATSLGQMAFGRDVNIPPTLYRGPGQPLTVYVNKYIDLVKYYQNVAVR